MTLLLVNNKIMLSHLYSRHDSGFQCTVISNNNKKNVRVKQWIVMDLQKERINFWGDIDTAYLIITLLL